MKFDFEPFYVTKFKPIRFEKFDPDQPIVFQDTGIEKEIVSCRDDVVRISNERNSLKSSEWEYNHVCEIILTFRASLQKVLTDCYERIKNDGDASDTELLSEVSRSILKLQGPLSECILQCLAAIKVREGEEAYQKALAIWVEKTKKDSSK